MMHFDIRRLDIYRHVPANMTQSTLSGAFVSVISVLFIIFLVCAELSSFLQITIKTEMFVDMPTREKELSVKLNVSFPKTECEFIGLDIVDNKGREEVGYHENTKKVALRNGAGCRFEGHFHVKRVPGNFHLSTHNSGRQPELADMSHYVHSLQFGDVLHGITVYAFDAMKDTDHLAVTSLSTHDYTLNIVPTQFKRRSGEMRKTFQYSFTHKEHIDFTDDGKPKIPVVWFKYDFTAITIRYAEERKPLYHFITMFCAVIGGTYTVGNIINALILSAYSVVFEKNKHW